MLFKIIADSQYQIDQELAEIGLVRKGNRLLTKGKDLVDFFSKSSLVVVDVNESKFRDVLHKALNSNCFQQVTGPESLQR